VLLLRSVVAVFALIAIISVASLVVTSRLFEEMVRVGSLDV